MIDNFSSLGKVLLLAGAVLMIVGIAFLFIGNKIPFLGNLPGDILIRKKNFTFYFPVVTGIVLSILFTLILYLIRRFNR